MPRTRACGAPGARRRRPRRPPARSPRARVSCTTTSSPSAVTASIRVSKPRWATRSIIACCAPSVRARRAPRGRAGAATASPSRVTGPTKPMTNSLAGARRGRRGLPACSMRPSFMTTICSATSIASSWSWVTKIVVTCTSSCSRRSQSRSSWRTLGVERAERLVEQQHLAAPPPARGRAPSAGAGRPRAGRDSGRRSPSRCTSASISSTRARDLVLRALADRAARSATFSRTVMCLNGA